MSGIALAFHRGGGPVDGQAFARVVSALSHRGGPPQTVSGDGVVLARLHRAFTVEDQADPPLTGLAPGVWLALDGRLDNRPELAAALGLSPAEERGWSDAAYAASVFARWGEAGLARLVGEVALAIWDAARRRVILFRDALGDRSLYYAVSGELLVAASEPFAVAAAIGSWDLDRERLASWFALREPPLGSTFFAGIREVPAAHLLAVDAATARLSRHWAPLADEIEGTDEERATRFREVLEEAVRCRLRARRPVSALLSGGLDSAPMAMLAARHQGTLRTISWVFSRHRASDERRFVAAMAEALPLDTVLFEADELGPELEAWPLNPNTPEETPYRAVMDRAYRLAAAGGSEVLLAGTWGDDLYWGGESWWWSLVRDGRLKAALDDGRAAIGEMGARRFLRSCVARPLVPGPLLRRLRPATPPPWLTPEAAALLPDPAPVPIPGRRANQQRAVLSSGNAHHAAAETRLTAMAGIEVRYPFRDRRLVELALSLPAYDLYRGRWTRPVLRRAFHDLLPAMVLQREDKASMDPLFREGTAVAELRYRDLLLGSTALWSEYLRPEWVASAPPGQRESPGEELALWHALCLATWRPRMLSL